MPSLRLQAPGTPATVYHMYKKITSLGSSPECDVILADPLVAESFAHIHFDGQVYTLATASRRHEIAINGKKRKKHRLTHDDRIVIGPFELRFSMMDDEAPAFAEAAKTVADLDAYQKLYEFSARLMQKHSLAELLDALMDAVIEITNADKGFLILLEGEPARRQGRPQPQAREHRRRGVAALGLDRRQGGPHPPAGHHLRRDERRRVRRLEVGHEPQARAR